MEKSSFFNSRGGDRRYKAEVFAEYFASFIGNGVFPNPAENLMVQAGTDMTVKIKAGKAWINGYYYHNTADLTVKIDTADGILSRIDRIVVRLDLIERTVLRHTKKGVPSANPAPPELQRDADIYELALADISVYNGSVKIVQADITDLRLSELCGLVTQTVESVDTSQLFAQLESYIENYKSTTINGFSVWLENYKRTTSDDFMIWFNSIKNILNENVAANLLNMINEINYWIDDFPDAVIDGGDFVPVPADPVAQHNITPITHTNMIVDGGSMEVVNGNIVNLEEHASDQYAHQNIILDGNDG